MYIVNTNPTPQMLGTSTLMPTATGTNTASSAATNSAMQKRGFDDITEVANALKKHATIQPKQSALLDPDNWWWLGVGFTALGSVGYFCF
jgi:hypothetical protein